MSQDTNVSNLIINKLTKQQFEGIATPDPTQLYFITDDNGISSLDDISISSLSNGQILKYNSTSGKWENASLPAEVTETTVSGWGFTKNAGTVTSVNNVSPVNGNVTLSIPDPLPSQTGNSGKFLTTNGSAASWATVDALPSQTSQNGKFLTTNGTTASWADVPTELPSQTSQSGKFLTTNGSSVSWATVDALPSQTSQSGKFLTTNGTTASWANVPTEIPSQSGNNGKYLTTNGTSVSWANTPTEIPTQTGNSGKFLTTNGSAVSWATVDALPSQTSQSGKFLTTNGTTASWAVVDALPSTTTINDLTSSAQQDALNSGVTASTVSAVAANTSAIALKQDILTAGSNIQITSNTISATVPTNVSAFTNDSGYITSSALSGYQTTSNLVTSISASSTDAQYPSAKCVYDALQDSGGGGLSYSATCPAITISSGVASWSVTHNLGTQDVMVSLYNSSGAEQDKNVVINSGNSITVTFKSSSNVTAGSYTVVVFASGASSNTSNLADKSLSNLTSTASTNLDGQWVSKLTELFNAEGYPNSTVTNVSLSSYLPNDEYCYEILLCCSHNRNAAAGAVRVGLNSSLAGSVFGINDIYNYSVRNQVSNTFILPIGTSHSFTIEAMSWSIQGQLILTAFAYRRIGTNS